MNAKRSMIVTNEDGSVDYSGFLSMLRTTVRKYNNEMELPAAVENSKLNWKRADVPLVDQNQNGEDVLYYGDGDVSGQTFTFDFDTGSSDTFIPGPQCGMAQGCVGNTKYDESGQDEGNTTTITYGSGQVMGENYFDDVTVGGLKANRQNIISLTQAQGFSTSASDSLMGMGFGTIANSKQPPFWMTLLNQGKLSPSEFSFYLGRTQSGTQGNSLMTLAGRDSSRYTGAFTNLPVTRQGYWQVAVDGVAIGNGSALATEAGQGAIDTGTTAIIVPTAVLAQVVPQIPGAVPLPLSEAMTAIAYPCHSNPAASLVFGGKKFSINDLDFNLGPLDTSLGVSMASDPLTQIIQQIIQGLLGGLLGGSEPDIPANYCISSVIGADLIPGQEFYIIGDSFLKSWYSVYHYDSPSSAYVGLAKAV